MHAYICLVKFSHLRIRRQIKMSFPRQPLCQQSKNGSLSLTALAQELYVDCRRRMLSLLLVKLVGPRHPKVKKKRIEHSFFSIHITGVVLQTFCINFYVDEAVPTYLSYSGWQFSCIVIILRTQNLRAAVPSKIVLLSSRMLGLLSRQQYRI